MTLTQVQSLALGTFCALLLVVAGGSLIEWAKWIALLLTGVKPARTVKSPQATVGLFDILVTILVLVMFFLLASVVWRSLGLPSAARPQRPSIAAENTAPQTSPADSASLENQTEPGANGSGANDSESAIDAPNKAEPNNLDQPTPKSDSSESDSNRSDNKESASSDRNLVEAQNTDEPIQSSASKPPKPAGISQIQFIYSGYAMSAQLLCVLFMTFFILGRTNCSLKKLGWRSDQLASDVRAGFQCFLMLTPLILVLNALLQNVTKTPYEHPVQVMIKEYPWLLGVAFWQAAFCAPISEEFAFRTLLVGWFESIHFGRNKFKAFMLGDSGAMESTTDEVASESIVADKSDNSNPYRVASSIASDVNQDKHSTGNTPEIRAPWWPVLTSGTIFGLAHFNYGVSWFPLIIFGVVLGRLYQIRQSLVPGIVVHMLFNAMNVALLGLSLLVPKLAG